MKITILGSGTSHGIPMIGCRCPVCTSNNPRNNRLRASCLVEFAGRNILIDTTPEMRLQAIRTGLDRVDAVLMTHQHADHVVGFDDLRRFCSLQKECIPVYGNAATIDHLKAMFPYTIDSADHGVFEIPVIDFRTIDAPFELFGATVTPVPLVHGRWTCYGYRFGSFAYCTDVRRVPPESMDLLRDLDVLVLGALRHREHVTHFTVEQALEVVEELQPGQTYLTHICHDLEHDETSAALPNTVALAYDGLEIELPEPLRP